MAKKTRLSAKDKKQLEKLFLEQLEKEFQKSERLRKRKKVKKPVSKKVTRLRVGTKHERGTNKISIVFSQSVKDPNDVMNALDSFDWTKLNSLLRKNKPDGRHYKPPQAITVIFKFKDKGKFYYQSIISPLDMTISLKSIQQFVTDEYEKLIEDWNLFSVISEDIEELDEYSSGDITKINPSKLVEITIAFYYGKKES